MTSKEKDSSVHGSITPRRLRSGTPLGLSSGCRFAAEKMFGKSSTLHSKKDVGAKMSTRISDCKTQDHKKLSEMKEPEKDVICHVGGSKRKSPEQYPLKETLSSENSRKICKGTLPRETQRQVFKEVIPRDNARKVFKETLPKDNPRKVFKRTFPRENPSKEIAKQNVSDCCSSSKSKVTKRTKLRDLLKTSDIENALQNEKGKGGHRFQKPRHRSLSPAVFSKSILKESVKKRSHKILESSLEMVPVKSNCCLAGEGVKAKPRNHAEHEKVDSETPNRRVPACETLEKSDDYWVMRKHYLQMDKPNSTSLRTKAMKTLSEEGCPGLDSGCHLQARTDSYRQRSSRLLTKESLQKNAKLNIVMTVKPWSTSLASPACGKSQTIAYSCADNQTNHESVGALVHKKSDFAETKASDTKSEIRVFFREPSTANSDRVIVNVCDKNHYEHRYNGCRPQSCHDYEGVADLCFQTCDLPDPRTEQVLEESTLPPVANTVELLTEPRSDHHDDSPHQHDYDNDDEGGRIHAYRPTYHRRQAGNCREEGSQNRPALPVLEPKPTCKSEPADEMVEPACVEIGQHPLEEDVCHGKEDGNARDEKRGVGSENTEDGVSKQRTVELEETHAEPVVCKLDTVVSDFSDKIRNVCGADSGSNQDDSRCRRRRKGRPSRRTKTDGRWLTDSSGMSPREGTGLTGGDTSKDAGSPHLPGDKGKPPGELSGPKSMGTRQGEASNGGGRRSRKGVEVETLWTNPELDTHAFLLWASENRHDMQKRHPAASSGEVEHLLARQWGEVAFAGKVHFLCRAREAGTDQDKHGVRKKKAGAERKQAPSTDGSSVYQQFLALPVDRQRDLLRKWLKFFQKMLPRVEYQEFINDFKKACKSLQLRPVSARRKNARLRNLDPSHYQMLFEKIRVSRPHVISLYNKRKAREDRLLYQSFHALVRRLVLGQAWSFVRGCRSKVLGELLKDIQQLEVEEALAQIDPPFSLTPREVHDVLGHDTSSLPLHPSPATSAPLSSTKDLFDDVKASSPSVTALSAAGHDSVSSNNSNNSNNYYKSSSAIASHSSVSNINNSSVSQASKDTTVASRTGQTSPVRPTLCISNNCSNKNSSNNISTISRELPTGPELPENALVLNLLDGLQHATDLPVLDQRWLDAVFLGPPPRIRLTVHARDGQQFQHATTPTTASTTSSTSATAYRRTLLYKHIHPLVDVHPLPLGLSPLYHGHTARFFFQEDR